mmetsp:Transcript_11362/g.39617  ORF Transcript_11362/g.39617 Transcript_11362/m.39617 type:complete len:129 (-) Transcript_11362:60-446(-)
MERADFEARLVRYPRVRSSDFVMPSSAVAGASRPRSPPKPVAIADEDVDGVDAVDYSAVTAVPEFWSALRAFLRVHFAEADAAEVERRFEAAHFAFVDGLSAEDLADVAAATEPERAAGGGGGGGAAR